MALYGKSVVANVILELECLEKLIIQFEKELVSLPQGGLCRKIIRGRQYLYHYKRSESNPETFVQKFLSKEDGKLKQGIKRRHFIEKSLPLLYRNLDAIKDFLEMYNIFDPSDVVLSLPGVYADIDYSMYSFGGEDGCAMGWGDAEYEKNEQYKDGLVYGTVGGLMVRSKSEAIIAGLLEATNIPFRYEAALKLGENVYYPDFTIMRPRDNKILYWEHFGMMDDKEYALRAEYKLAVYRENCIFPWNQLITTYETAKAPLNAQDIQSVIKAVLL